MDNQVPDIARTIPEVEHTVVGPQYFFAERNFANLLVTVLTPRLSLNLSEFLLGTDVNSRGRGKYYNIRAPLETAMIQ